MQYPPDQPGQQPPQQPNTFYPSQHPTFPQQQPYYPPYGAPQQPYPPQYPPQPGYPPPQPPKKNKTGLWVGIGIAILVIFACIASGSHGSSSPDTTVASTSNTSNAAPQPTQAPTATPKPLKWTSTHTFKGNGEQKTAIFNVPDDWAIIWACNPASSFGGSYNVIVTVYNSDGTMADVAINSICKTGTINGQTEEHQGGQVYLDISSEGDWAVQVLEMK